jgi:Zn-finger protein
MFFQNPYASTTVWECKDCGYVSSISIEDGNLEKQLKETRKMEKISQNLLWKR